MFATPMHTYSSEESQIFFATWAKERVFRAHFGALPRIVFHKTFVLRKQKFV